jgi:ParB/RepB/Spo0J family partition protein
MVVEPGKQSGKPGFFIVDYRLNVHHAFFTTEREATKALPKYELIAGERRWRAAQIAAQVTHVKTIPAMIGNYSDAAALEIQIIENEQRKELDDMERARGYAKMHGELGYSVEQIAQKIDKSTSYVREFLKLGGLPEIAVKALERGDDGGISRSTAVLIARIPDPKEREQAAKKIIKPQYRDTPLSYREAKQLIEREFMRELKGAPFDLDDETLLPEANVPSCKACPRRSGNTPEQYQGKRSDICLMPSCYEQKVNAFNLRALQTAQTKGFRVLTGKDADEAFRYHGNYVDLDEKNYDDPKYRTWRTLLGKKEPHELCVAQDDNGKPHYFYPREAAKKEVKAKHGIGSRNGSDAQQQRQAEFRRKQKIRREAAHQALALLADSAEKNAPNFAIPTQLEALLDRTIRQTGNDTQRLVVRRRGVEALKQRWGSDDFEATLKQQIVPALSKAQRWGLMAELLAASKLVWWITGSDETSDELLKLFAAFQVDLKGLEQHIAELHAEKERAKKKPAKAKAARV